MTACRAPFAIGLLPIVSIVAALGHVTPLRAAPSEDCPTMTSYELRAHVVDEAGAGPQILDVAAAEAGRIWARVGLRLAWSIAPAALHPPDGRSVIVVIRRELRPLPSMGAASSKGRARRPLGWLVFGPDGRPGNLIEASFGALALLVERRSYMDVPIGALPESARHPILGRALGRVIAHELGHWFMGRGHAPAGLMRASFGAHDLIDHELPQLPRAWMAADADGRTPPSSPCVPLVLQRLARASRQGGTATSTQSRLPAC